MLCAKNVENLFIKLTLTNKIKYNSGMENKEYQKIADFMLKTIKKAYKVCSKQKIEVKDKNEFDLVTTLDTSIEQYVLDKINKKFGDVKVISEEFNSKVEAGGTYFVIDPIDGTINFANGIDAWGVQMAYIEDNETKAAAIYRPNDGAEYIAIKGCGAYRNGKKFVCTVKPPLKSVYAIELKNIEYENKACAYLYDKLLRYRRLNASCINSIYTAEGNFGAYIAQNGNPWDIRPGNLLMEEAGCFHKDVGRATLFASSQEILDILEKAHEFASVALKEPTKTAKPATKTTATKTTKKTTSKTLTKKVEPKKTKKTTKK
ncbi:MAG: inositol monophosphatase [Clostridia bacterium]|nr:inositol monophosphatase [Clostridia bacterium]